MTKIVTFDAKKCIGCKICELICSFSNAKEFSVSKSRIRSSVDLREAVFYSAVCMHCEDPACLRACPCDAVYKENGVVKIKSEDCTGCKQCISACLFGNLHFDEDAGLPIKCQLCEGNPKCVEYCPTGALQYQENAIATHQKQL